MNNATLTPCPEWAEKLAGTHPDDLSPSDREALNAHVASCSACTLVRSQYDEVAMLIRNLPANDVPTDLPPELLRLWKEETEPPGLTKRAVITSTEGDSSLLARSATRPKRRTRIMSILAAVLITAVLLGYFVAHFPGYGGQSVNPNGSHTGGTISGDVEILSPLPAFSQSTVYVSTGVIRAFRSADGSLIRSYTIGTKSDSQSFEPTIVNGVMYVIVKLYPAPGSPGLDGVYALRVSDSAILWHVTVGSITSSPPIIADNLAVADGVVYVTTSDHSLHAFRASNGAFLWHYKASGSSEEGISIPLVAQGVAYVGLEDTQNAYLDALNTRDGTLRWHRQVGKQFVAPALAHGVIYAGTRGLVSAWRASDGLLLWQYHIGSSIDVPIVINGVVYAIADNGYVYALRATNGTPLWRYRIGDWASSRSAPIVTNGILYAGVFTGFGSTEGSYIYALSIKDGHVIWRYKVGWNVVPSLAYGNGAIYFVTVPKIPNALYALRASNGTVLWHTDIPYA